ncbi:undecaprenyldiphospho-muramoylpentapeptide beta-N-acetylglucosaminyltransferase [Pajaroellobacter abortibovis]|uniref:UDP-N-acetylglucosamine--N-acetylmuramyl-(pentapeptide) pyrophosphoryl-undecaprenol N-acetylglucosamine transferase n=1 Tax=Pajaroellobacter abortibovis TaxID=1882918 RepID=A0A1L6MW86_9BACT|nr:undecaprenyldiphospho-muramoylpentapeptide beta-N-acetylglucosaminyltransferase [Pajaroellobacter abortibovis]APR99685.1 undecaprenyldiphospho-muramoylpentapeptide beta-N-acetylglucosaminyltransferase [Pajaroellobacter abortibovis]
MSQRLCIWIAGGGTGGHVFPALAVAHALCQLADVRIIFSGTPGGLENRFVPACGYQLELFPILPIQGSHLWRMIRAVAIAGRETVLSANRLRRLGPVHAVFSMGGYSAGPVGLAAAMLGIPLAICEANAVLGLSNRWLVHLASRIYLGWEDTAASLTSISDRVRISGVPLRAQFELQPLSSEQPARILVVGGSQGAAYLNQTIPTVLALVAQHVERPFEVIHQSGEEAIESVRQIYVTHGLKRVQVVSFLHTMFGALRDATLIISRAGASTLAEIAAVGRPSILIPFPFAADNHQTRNAMIMEKAGGAFWFSQAEAEPSCIAEKIIQLLNHPDECIRMGECAGSLGKPKAAWYIARDLLDLINTRDSDPSSLIPALSSSSFGIEVPAQNSWIRKS